MALSLTDLQNKHGQGPFLGMSYFQSEEQQAREWILSAETGSDEARNGWSFFVSMQ